jgi:hypothetical protein
MLLADCGLRGAEVGNLRGRQQSCPWARVAARASAFNRLTIGGMPPDILSTLWHGAPVTMELLAGLDDEDDDEPPRARRRPALAISG